MDAVLSFLSSPAGIACIALLVVVIVGIGIGVARSSKKSMPTITPATPATPVTAAPTTPADEVPADAPDARGSPSPIDEAALCAPTSAPVVDGGQDQLAAPVEETVEAPELSVEVPESLPSRMARLRSRLSRSGTLGKAIVSVLSRGELKAADWEEVEDTLLVADLGLEATDTLIEALKNRVAVEGVHDTDSIKRFLSEELLALVDPAMDRSLHLDRQGDKGELPASILMVGVNGTGKTTTVGKLARVLVAEGKSVLLGAADTFRAAAGEQLGTWGERVGVEVVASDREGADPASVAFDALKAGADKNIDVVLVDTAGRLQTKSTLMDELGKVKRVMEKQAPVNEVLLVLDATTGQNGMKQAEVFAEVVGVTGIVLTKLDGSAKGGIVVSVQKALGVPVKFVGLGEGADDLAPFDPQGFVDAIVNG
ncbi:signal recognition particle-docking protein FtsY [Pauljensenia sp. UMB6358]|uniref:signal recognition particle-docking protein FtsY n=1 Tax=Pauljensenia sp. UMB6358 TaxID=3046335 RepID=UPI00254DD448|nr:signal recognition particle-docking protein FtsY [Pauljensenia sp. UMB6358]MDK7121529.1 signal recognition particle-docking protein FtsY [Pauljensenia sp. UMB6358]